MERADVILVRAHDVDTVIVDGRIREYRGDLVDIDEAKVVRSTERALAALLAR